jgi:crotonobetainyl-CoA:carnitine CoA-transferase CaiB-like acyl-CoA transferase
MKTQPMTSKAHTGQASSRLSRGFASVFATADGERVMVAALDQRQFADLAKTARLTSTLAFLERVLQADFSHDQDLYIHRHAIATMLTAWFGRHTVTELATAFAGTSVPWRLCPTSPGDRHPSDVLAL